MTLFDALGLYLGWDRCAAGCYIKTFNGSTQLQVGRLLLGCDWFFKRPSRVRDRSSDHQ